MRKERETEMNGDRLKILAMLPAGGEASSTKASLVCNGALSSCDVPGDGTLADFDQSGVLTAGDLTRLVANRMNPALVNGCYL